MVVELWVVVEGFQILCGYWACFFGKYGNYKCFIATRVPSGGIVMVAFEDVKFDWAVVWHV